MFKTFMLAGLFFLFKLIVLVSSIFVIFSANPVHSVLFLVLVFINSAFLLMFLEADFMALILIVVYVGAIAVLFLFICNDVKHTCRAGKNFFSSLFACQ